jgi:quercetin dioxygenase-like cupin family protein
MEEKQLGQVGQRVIFENERVRIWQMCLEPGEESDFHEHKLDYVMCIVEGESPGRTGQADDSTAPRIRM